MTPLTAEQMEQMEARYQYERAWMGAEPMQIPTWAQACKDVTDLLAEVKRLRAREVPIVDLLNQYGAEMFRADGGAIEVMVDVDNDHYDWVPAADWQIAYAIRQAVKEAQS